MYTIYSGSASLLFKKIYNNSDKHVTLLLETALVPFPVSQFRTVHIFRLLSSEHDDTISILQH